MRQTLMQGTISAMLLLLQTLPANGLADSLAIDNAPRGTVQCEQVGAIADDASSSCATYYICAVNSDNVLEPVFARCPGTTVFSRILRECVDTATYTCQGAASEVSTRDVGFQCTEDGRFPNVASTDCKSYYLCTKNTDGSLIAALVTCPTSNIYSEEMKSCVSSPPNVCPYAPATTTQEPQSSSTLAAPGETFVCPGQGRFVDEQSPDCSTYYLCVIINNKLSPQLSACPKGSVFTPIEQKCVTEDAYTCPMLTVPTVTPPSLTTPVMTTAEVTTRIPLTTPDAGVSTTAATSEATTNIPITITPQSSTITTTVVETTQVTTNIPITITPGSTSTSTITTTEAETTTSTSSEVTTNIPITITPGSTSTSSIMTTEAETTTAEVTTETSTSTSEATETSEVTTNIPITITPGSTSTATITTTEAETTTEEVTTETPTSASEATETSEVTTNIPITITPGSTSTATITTTESEITTSEMTTETPTLTSEVTETSEVTTNIPVTITSESTSTSTTTTSEAGTTTSEMTTEMESSTTDVTLTTAEEDTSTAPSSTTGFTTTEDPETPPPIKLTTSTRPTPTSSSEASTTSSTTSLPSTTGVGSGDGGECAEEGRYPDPSSIDCVSYILCVRNSLGTLTPIKFLCPPTTIFSDTVGLCVSVLSYSCKYDTSSTIPPTTISPTTTTTVEPTPTRFVCPNSGRYPNPDSIYCKSYYLCLYDGKLDLIGIELSCPAGSIFATDVLRCAPAEQYQCVEGIATTAAVPTTTTTVATTTVGVTTPSMAGTCTTPGKFPTSTPNDCTSYQFCVLVASGELAEVILKCPGNTLFDEQKKKCSDQFVCNRE